jgi:hypothetical protein
MKSRPEGSTWYTSFAVTFNRTVGRELAPVGHLGGGPGDSG